ncbi:MAG TPA: hypothetical protein VKB18_04615 [Gemmatimonadota bacterium]|nr:hypothetical protein [Gemmatimonadota bacterium]
MATSTSPRQSAFLERLRRTEPLVAVELRPPPADLPSDEGMETWLDLHHALRRLGRRDTAVFLTDDAVGEREEENLRHLVTNLAGEVPRDRLVPFLTCKHSMGYCLRYADRAASRGLEALVVLGGDPEAGPPRCVPHAYQLRRRIRDRVPGLELGGWANPHRDPAEQVSYLIDEAFTGEFYLTQVVSHHTAGRVEAFVEEARRRDLEMPGVFGVFYYRSATPSTLEKLSDFFPVPAEELTREFERGATPETVCARSIRALRDAGVRHVYISNLGHRRAPERLGRILDAAAAG